MALFMVVETFRHGDPLPVYRRFRDRGRLAPEGLRYVDSLGRRADDPLLAGHGDR
jgi:hypothetical protein